MLACVLLLLTATQTDVANVSYTIELTTPIESFNNEFCWFQPRAAAIPGAGKDGMPLVVLTLQKHFLSSSDYYSGIHVMKSADLGATWTTPEPRPELDWRHEPDGMVVGICDMTPGWHAPTKKLLLIGHTVRYREGKLAEESRSRETPFSVYDPAADTWTPWRIVDMPDKKKFYNGGAGCAQWLVEDDGSLLIPIYYKEQSNDPNACSSATVMRCAFDGTTVSYREHGTELALDVPRGLDEPSLTRFRGKYYLTIRNDQRGYATVSDDGLHFAPITPWTFDDGSELGSYNTQQHWVTHSDGLFLAYTRRGANNDDIFRHRAPLFIAQVDPEKLCVIRATERELLPNRGATYGNFGASNITENETWVTDAEGMFFPEVYKKYGAKGAVFAAKLRWSKPNLTAN
ncbi:MAG: glycoside hydrolase [Candidatus Hydrogenedentes bacterium]|nr:glycoside hydrolase [Candidatus Hydrogenedentota bacterium]